MRIEGLFIDGFGLFHDLAVPDLPPGLTILQGDNESGKTTLMHFIRTALFGYPPGKKGEDYYPPLRGGAPGGRLVLVRGEGQRVTIERTLRTVTLREGEGAPQQAEPAERLLEGMDRGTYERIFAIGLRDMRGLEVLSQDRVRQRLMGAGAGLGAVSLAEVREALDKDLESLVKTRARTRIINKLVADLGQTDRNLREVQAIGPRYRELQSELERLEEQLAADRQRQTDLRGRRARLESLRAMREPWLRLREAQACQGELAHAERFPAQGLERWDSRAQQEADLRAEAETRRAEADRLERELTQVAAEEPVLAEQQAIERLLLEREKLAEAAASLPAVRQERAQAQRELERRLAELGPDWEAARLAQVDTSVAVRQYAQEARRRLEVAERAVEQSRTRRQATQEALQAEEASQQQQAAAEGPVQPAPAALPAALAWGMGLALLLGGGLLAAGGERGGAGVAWMLAPVATGLLLWLRRRVSALAETERRRRRQGTSELAQQRLQQARQAAERAAAVVQEAEAELARIQQAWRDWLAQQGLDSALRPEGYEAVLSAVERARDAEEDLRKAGERTAQVEAYRAEMRGRLAEVLTACRREAPPEPGPAELDALREALETARRAEAQRRALSGKLDAVREALGKLTRQHEDVAAQQQALLAEAGVSAEEQFRVRAEEHEQWRRAQAAAREAGLELSARAGTEQARAELEEQLARTEPLQVQSDLDEADHHLQQVEEDLREHAEDKGKRSGELEVLAHDERLGELLLQRRGQEEELREHTRRWAALALARHLLDATRQRYERERRPQVIGQAEEYLQAMTAGRYSLVVALDNTVQLRDQAEASKTEGQWSMGLAEQVYLALRLALAQGFAVHGESLPLLLDDVLVNFDPQRRKGLTEVLVEIARRQQVLLLTCHPQTVRCLLDAAQAAGEPVGHYRLHAGQVEAVATGSPAT